MKKEFNLKKKKHWTEVGKERMNLHPSKLSLEEEFKLREKRETLNFYVYYKQKHVKEFIKIIKDWCWKNNTIPMKDSNLRLATTDGGWVNVIELHKFIDKKAGKGLVE